MRSTDLRKSRYVQGGTTDVHPDRLGWWERRVFKRDVSDVEFVITAKYHQRPYKLAYDVYGSDDYEFFILQYNNILDVMTEFVEGNVVMLPTVDRFMIDMMNRPIGGKPV